MFTNIIYESRFFYVNKGENVLHPSLKEEYIFTSNWWGDGRILKPCDDSYWNSEEIKNKIWEKSCGVKKDFFSCNVDVQSIDDDRAALLEDYISKKDLFFEKINKGEVEPLICPKFRWGGAIPLIDDDKNKIIFLNYVDYVYPIHETAISAFDHWGCLEEYSSIDYFWDYENEFVYMALKDRIAETEKDFYCFIAGIKPISVGDDSMPDELEEFRLQIMGRGMWKSKNHEEIVAKHKTEVVG